MPEKSFFRLPFVKERAGGFFEYKNGAPLKLNEKNVIIDVPIKS